MLDPIVIAALCLPAVFLTIFAWPRAHKWLYDNIYNRGEKVPLPWE